jgi:2-keto-3-deoxy-L-fuconate dehydrogenase
LGVLVSIHLKNKCEVITGAASGIGPAIITTFAANGATVVLLDLDEKRTLSAASEITSRHAASTMGVARDVFREDSVAKSFARIFASVNILVNCAGIAHVASLATTEVGDFETVCTTLTSAAPTAA